MKQLLSLCALACLVPLLIAAATPQSLGGGLDHEPQDPVELPAIRCDCNTLPTIASSCELCVPVATITLHRKRAVCTPYDLNTGTGCDPQEDECERRMGVTLSAPCDMSLVLDASAPCRGNDTDEADCPVGGGTVKLTLFCLPCSAL